MWKEGPPFTISKSLRFNYVSLYTYKLRVCAPVPHSSTLQIHVRLSTQHLNFQQTERLEI